MLRRLCTLSLLLCLVTLGPSLVSAQEPRAQSGPQVWADTNGDGFLQPPEIQRLVEAGLVMFAGPHPGRTPVDGQCDLNKDGFIGPDEIERARVRLMDQVPRLPETNADLSRLLDLDRNGRLERPEGQEVVEYLWVDPATMVPHPSSRPLDRAADRNNDGRVGEERIDESYARITRSCP